MHVVNLLTIGQLRRVSRAAATRSAPFLSQRRCNAAPIHTEQKQANTHGWSETAPRTRNQRQPRHIEKTRESQRQTDKQVSVCVDVGPREKGGDLSWPQTDCNQIAACPHPPTQTRPLVTLLIRQPSICAEGTNALSPTVSVRPRAGDGSADTGSRSLSLLTFPHHTHATYGSRSKHEPYL